MISRLMGSVILTALAASLAGCANSGGTPIPPTSGTSATHASSDRLGGVTIAEFHDLPEYSGYYAPAAIAKDAGSLWVADDIDQDFGECVVVQIAPSGKALNNFYYSGRSTEGASFQDIVGGPDGALWITDSYNSQILRMTTKGVYTSFPIASSPPERITTGPDKALWFTFYGGIGRLTTSGHVKT